MTWQHVGHSLGPRREGSAIEGLRVVLLNVTSISIFLPYLQIPKYLYEAQASRSWAAIAQAIFHTKLRVD